MKENWEYAKLVIENLDEDSKTRMNSNKEEKEEENEERENAAQQRQQSALDAMRKRQAQFEDMLVSSSSSSEEDEEDEEDEDDEEEDEEEEEKEESEENENVAANSNGESTGIVRIHGMISERGLELNGRKGRIIQWNPEKGRYAVQLIEDTSTRCWIKPINLILTKELEKEKGICCLCKESKPDEPLCLISLLQFNNAWPSQGSPETRENNKRQKQEARTSYSEIDSKSCLFRSCGHFVHNSCKERYFHTLYERYHRGQPVEGQRVVDYTIGSGEFICPVCRRLANCIVRISHCRITGTR